MMPIKVLTRNFFLKPKQKIKLIIRVITKAFEKAIHKLWRLNPTKRAGKVKGSLSYSMRSFVCIPKNESNWKQRLDTSICLQQMIIEPNSESSILDECMESKTSFASSWKITLSKPRPIIQGFMQTKCFTLLNTNQTWDSSGPTNNKLSPDHHKAPSPDLSKKHPQIALHQYYI